MDVTGKSIRFEFVQEERVGNRVKGLGEVKEYHVCLCALVT